MVGGESGERLPLALLGSATTNDDHDDVTTTINDDQNETNTAKPISRKRIKRNGTPGKVRIIRIISQTFEASAFRKRTARRKSF